MYSLKKQLMIYIMIIRIKIGRKLNADGEYEYCFSDESDED